MYGLLRQKCERHGGVHGTFTPAFALIPLIVNEVIGHINRGDSELDGGGRNDSRLHVSPEGEAGGYHHTRPDGMIAVAE